MTQVVPFERREVEVSDDFCTQRWRVARTLRARTLRAGRTFSSVSGGFFAGKFAWVVFHRRLRELAPFSAEISGDSIEDPHCALRVKAEFCQGVPDCENEQEVENDRVHGRGKKSIDAGHDTLCWTRE